MQRLGAMRSILPLPLLAATLPSLIACESKEQPAEEAGAQHDIDASQHDADESVPDDGAPSHAASAPSEPSAGRWRLPL